MEAPHSPAAQDPQMANAHQSVVDMFPELDLETTIAEYGHMSTEALASWIVDHLESLPKKRRGAKRKADTSPDRASHCSDGSFFDDSSGLERTQMNKMMWEIVRRMKHEVKHSPPVPREQFMMLHIALANHFPSVRLDFARKVVGELSGRLMAVALACFLSENSAPYAIQHAATGHDKILPPLKTKRLPRSKLDLSVPFLNTSIEEELARYENFIDTVRVKYPTLFDSSGKLNNESVVEPEVDGVMEKMECLVCYDEFSIISMVFCNAPFYREEEESDPNAPSTSSALNAQPLYDPMPAHAFCSGCIRGHAQASVEEMPLARGGLGLRCMVPDCKNPILYEEVCHLIRKDVKRKLDERIVEENLGMAALAYLERCPACNFAMEMEVPAEINKVFKCHNCDAETCRLCERAWDEDHFGRNCQEVDEKCKGDKRARQLEKRLNEAVIRKCPRCSLAFVKSEGCNKMTCRCGMTSCYICRQTPIDYSHFCQHIRDPTQKNFKCQQCDKPCLLFEDATLKDNKQLEEIRQADATGNQEDEEEGQKAEIQAVPAAPPLPAPAQPVADNAPLNRPYQFQGFMQGFFQPNNFANGNQGPWGADWIHPPVLPQPPQLLQQDPLQQPQQPYRRHPRQCTNCHTHLVARGADRDLWYCPRCGRAEDPRRDRLAEMAQHLAQRQQQQLQQPYHHAMFQQFAANDLHNPLGVPPPPIAPMPPFHYMPPMHAHWGDFPDPNVPHGNAQPAPLPFPDQLQAINPPNNQQQ